MTRKIAEKAFHEDKVEPLSSLLFSCLPSFASNVSDSDLLSVSSDSEFDDSFDSSIDDLAPTGLSTAALSSRSCGEKLFELRKLMRKYGIGVYIVPSEDEHQSEYTAPADKRRDYISGFTGSAGVAIVTLDDADSLTGRAYLSTDGRYFLQAEKQLDHEHWQLHKQGIANNPSWPELAMNCVVGNAAFHILSFDPRLMSILLLDQFEHARLLAYHFKFDIEPLMEVNLVDAVWGKDRPHRSLDPIYLHRMQYTGESVTSKLERIRKVLVSEDHGASHLIVTQLDEIAWLFNLRADNDIPYSPVFFAYSIVSLNSVTLYVDETKINESDSLLMIHLNLIENLVIKPYSLFYNDLEAVSTWLSHTLPKIVLPEKFLTTVALYHSIPKFLRNKVIHDSIIANLKVFKNPVELKNARIAQERDSLVFIIFAAWLEQQLLEKKRPITEYQASCKIYSIRRKMSGFKGLSYETISSSGPNAAIIHYAPSRTQSATIDPRKIYLLDSGAQYLEGTTDITRTFFFGHIVPDRYKKFYSLVLSGHLAVAMAKFPANSPTTSMILDSYGRHALWNEGLDYNHGTGHGIGSFGIVHERPLYISSAVTRGPDCFKVGAIVTDEPGYYVDGDAGFRIESDLEIIAADCGQDRSGNDFLAFNCMTKVPFCRKLVDPAYLSLMQIKWINLYNDEIRHLFSDKLLKMGLTSAHRWLLNETRPFGR